MILTYKYMENSKTKLKYILKDKLYISTKLLKKLKEFDAIFVNGKICFVNEIINKGDFIEVKLDKIKYLKNTSVVPKEHDLDILYEDEYILALNKPYNLDIHPSMGNFENTLANYVMAYFNKQKFNISKIHILTRLDKNTSGVCLIAKNEYIQELFIRLKDDIGLKKQYIAICSGILDSDHFYITKNITRKENSIILRRISDDDTIGEFAKTEVEVIERNMEKDYSVCNIILHTGRTHQIRVHLSSIMHPLLGDELYCNEVNPNYDIYKYIKRQALHSYKISFKHPITNKQIDIVSDIPDDMKKLISKN